MVSFFSFLSGLVNRTARQPVSDSSCDSRECGPVRSPLEEIRAGAWPVIDPESSATTTGDPSDPEKGAISLFEDVDGVLDVEHRSGDCGSYSLPFIYTFAIVATNYLHQSMLKEFQTPYFLSSVYNTITTVMCLCILVVIWLITDPGSDGASNAGSDARSDTDSDTDPYSDSDDTDSDSDSDSDSGSDHDVDEKRADTKSDRSNAPAPNDKPGDDWSFLGCEFTISMGGDYKRRRPNRCPDESDDEYHCEWCCDPMDEPSGPSDVEKYPSPDSKTDPSAKTHSTYTQTGQTTRAFTTDESHEDNQINAAAWKPFAFVLLYLLSEEGWWMSLLLVQPEWRRHVTYLSYPAFAALFAWQWAYSGSWRRISEEARPRFRAAAMAGTLAICWSYETSFEWWDCLVAVALHAFKDIVTRDILLGTSTDSSVELVLYGSAVCSFRALVTCFNSVEYGSIWPHIYGLSWTMYGKMALTGILYAVAQVAAAEVWRSWEPVRSAWIVMLPSLVCLALSTFHL
ncbi:hypothetical protein TWF696_000346 [Orbilia brochopaga]|uniref:Uncharacterized protein n=1 Tax=Orbilia brochopaga TaxID=3140254 RepID=A0AAV9VE25_9PEZI